MIYLKIPSFYFPSFQSVLTSWYRSVYNVYSSDFVCVHVCTTTAEPSIIGSLCDIYLTDQIYIPILHAKVTPMSLMYTHLFVCVCTFHFFVCAHQTHHVIICSILTRHDWGADSTTNIHFQNSINEAAHSIQHLRAMFGHLLLCPRPHLQNHKVPLRRVG